MAYSRFAGRWPGGAESWYLWPSADGLLHVWPPAADTGVDGLGRQTVTFSGTEPGTVLNGQAAAHLIGLLADFLVDEGSLNARGRRRIQVALHGDAR